MFTVEVAIEDLYARRTLAIGAAFYYALNAALYVGTVATFLRWKVGIPILLVGFVGLIAIRLVAGVSLYRRVMSRPWPAVPPLEDEDDEW